MHSLIKYCKSEHEKKVTAYASVRAAGRFVVQAPGAPCDSFCPGLEWFRMAQYFRFW